MATINSRPARGFALIVALILLLVMTMIAVVAMRSTTLDLKMTTNSALYRRAFQAAETVRASLAPIFEASIYETEWPAALVGATNGFDDALLPASADPANFTMTDDDYNPMGGTDVTLESVEDPGDARHTTPDIKYLADLNDDGVVENEDIKTDIWVTKLGPGRALTAAGGPGDGTEIKTVLFEIRARGRAASNAESVTQAEFRGRLK